MVKTQIMDTKDTKDQKNDYHQPRYNGRIWAGLFLLFLGGMYLMREMAFPFFPEWLFTWPMILILIGIFSALRSGCRGGGWIVLILVGGFFLLDEVDIGFSIHRYLVPLVIICIGFAMISRPRWHKRDDRDWWREKYERRHWRKYGPPPNRPSEYSTYTDIKNPDPSAQQQTYSSGPIPPESETATGDYLDSVSVFGGVRKVIMSKHFKGGEATSVMGGTELDFTQADINGTVELELTQVMGGAKLIVPGNWTIRNEVNAVFGGVDDKRQVHITPDPNKVLVLKGTSFLGGLEIRNY